MAGLRCSTTAVWLAALAIVALWPRGAWALSCIPEYRERALAGADLVFEAEALSVTRASRDEPQRVRLSVVRVWKGEPDPELVVLVGGFKGGYPFEASQRYLVFAVRDGDELYSRDCGGTVLLSDAAEQLAILAQQAPLPRAIRPTTSTAAPASSAPTTTPPPDSEREPPLAAPIPPGSPTPPPASPKGGGCGACALSTVGTRDHGAGSLLLGIAALWATRRGRRVSPSPARVYWGLRPTTESPTMMPPVTRPHPPRPLVRGLLLAVLLGTSAWLAIGCGPKAPPEPPSAPNAPEAPSVPQLAPPSIPSPPSPPSLFAP